MKKGTGAANTLKEPMGSELRILQLRMWAGRGAGAQRSQGRHGSLPDPLQQRSLQSSPRQPLVWIYCPSPSAWWPVRRPLCIWESRFLGFTGHKKREERKMQQHMVLSEWMTALKCELDFVVRTSNKNNNKICVLLASPHLLRCIPNTTSLSRAASTNLSKNPRFAHPGTEVTPWSQDFPSSPAGPAAGCQLGSRSRAAELLNPSLMEGRVCYPIPSPKLARALPVLWHPEGVARRLAGCTNTDLSFWKIWK